MVARLSQATCILDTGEATVGQIPLSHGRKTFYLLPGHIFVSSEACLITTILGSCVSVCLWDPIFQIGGANHFQLPCCINNARHSPKFGTAAIPRLIDELLALGCKKSNLRARLFGGACVMEPFRSREDHLGLRNVRIGLDLLQDEGIAVLDQDVGGRYGRRVVFNTCDGSCLVRPL